MRSSIGRMLLWFIRARVPPVPLTAADLNAFSTSLRDEIVHDQSLADSRASRPESAPDAEACDQ